MKVMNRLIRCLAVGLTLLWVGWHCPCAAGANVQDAPAKAAADVAPETTDVNPAAASPGPIVLYVTRDTTISSHPTEQAANLGSAHRLKAKSIIEFALMDVDPTALVGHVVRGARLYVHCESPASPLRRVTVSTLASDWGEGDSQGYRPAAGGASFLWARHNEQPWAQPGSDITAVINGRGHTFWRFADAQGPNRTGWQCIAVDPTVVAARVAGVSGGFVLFDDVGSEYDRVGPQFVYHPFPNRYLSSHEAGRKYAPYFQVDLGAADDQPPAAVDTLHAASADLPPGEAMVTWPVPRDTGPAGTIGFLARAAPGDAFDWDTAADVPRYLVPMAAGAQPGATVTMHLHDLPALEPGAAVTLGVRPVDGAGNVGPVTTVRLQLSAARPDALITAAPIKPFSDDDPAAALPTVGGVAVFVADALDKIEPATGRMIPPRLESYQRANHLWSAAQKRVRLFAGRNEFVAFQLILLGQADDVTAKLTFDGDGDGEHRPHAAMYRFGLVNAGRGPMPDPLLPIAGRTEVNVTGFTADPQPRTALLADVYVPHDASPGDQHGTLTLTVGGQTLAIDVDLHVWNFTLPDVLSFVPQMNCYGLPGPRVEIDYYRLAHRNRTCLNRLPYNWKGQVGDGLAPMAESGALRWDEYDRRVGPLLDGSAFKNEPRRSVPVDALYLPINENWPMDIFAAESGFTGSYWADEAFSAGYHFQLVNAARRFVEHAKQRGWNDTVFEFYLNNRIDQKSKSWSATSAAGTWYNGSAPWLFDEPVHTQDFWALRWYGKAFNQGVSVAESEQAHGPEDRGVKFAFRCDVSRPQWQRDMLDGVMDVWAVGGSLRQYHRMIAEQQRRFGPLVYVYGGTNGVAHSNAQPAAWCLQAWCLGADGVIPWNTVNLSGPQSDGFATMLLYPTGEVGWGRPAPSVRLKAYRRGQQDVEYLVMLTQALNQPRWAVGGAVLRELGLPPADAVVQRKALTYDRLDPAALWSLRTQVGAMLDRAHPEPKRKLLDLHPPPHAGRALPPLGHIEAR